MLTNRPDIVIAKPPSRTRKTKPSPKITRAVVGQREPSPEISQEEYEARGRKADELMREVVRRASQK